MLESSSRFFSFLFCTVVCVFYCICMDLHALLGLSLTESAFVEAFYPLVSRADPSLGKLTPQTIPEPSKIKSYTNTVYLNYQQWGFSLQLEQPKNKSTGKVSTSRIHEVKNDADALIPAKWMDQLGDPHGYKISAIDIYNPPDVSTQKANAPKTSTRKYNITDWAVFPAYPIAIRKLDEANTGKDIILKIDNSTSGKELVQCLGEPDRKGGGQGARQGGIGIWVEWNDVGLMAEWSDAQGPKAWDDGASNPWKVLTLFPRGSAKEEDDF